MLSKSKCAFHGSKVGNICSFQKLHDILLLEVCKLRTESIHLEEAVKSCLQELIVIKMLYNDIFKWQEIPLCTSKGFHRHSSVQLYTAQVSNLKMHQLSWQCTYAYIWWPNILGLCWDLRKRHFKKKFMGRSNE